MTHIMLDLETWGTTPGSDIRSIGACVFYPGAAGGGAWEQSGERTFYIACDNPSDGGAPCPPAMKNVRLPDGTQWYFDGVDMLRKYPLTRDPRTVQWWSEQSDEAQAAFANPVDLRDALSKFTLWYSALDVQDVNNGNQGIRLWAHGSHFDIPILAAAYQAVGLPVPWHYRAPRDTRTCFDMAGIDDHSAWLKQHPGPLGIPHHALDDAICQARGVCGAYARLRIPHNVRTHRDAWFGALEQLDQQERASEDCYNVGYYAHERKVFVDTFDVLCNHPHLEK